jgi:hypothetical protein
MENRTSASLLLAALCMLPSIAVAQSVLLQIRPRAGDTMIVRVDQRVEVTGVPTDCVTGYSAPGRGENREIASRACAESSRQMTTVMEVFSRAIVIGSSIDGARVLAVTDSIRTSMSSGKARSARPTRARPSHGSLELLVSTDGETKVADADATQEVRAIFGQMPATLSRRPVAVGEKWVRQMRVPLSTEAGASGLVRATFKLDSLGRNGDVAYISMTGTLSHDHTDGTDSELEGWLSGSMRLDRRLAWITDTHAVIDAESMIRSNTGGQPMRVRTKITQTLRSRPAR